MKYTVVVLISILLAGCFSAYNFTRPEKIPNVCPSCTEGGGNSGDVSPVFDD